MLAVCLPITSTPWVFLKSLGQRRNSTLLEDSFPEFSLTHRGSYSGNLKPGMEFGMKILRTFLPPIATEQTTVPTSGLRSLTSGSSAGTRSSQVRWKARRMAGMELSHPSGIRQQQTLQSLCQGAQQLPELPEPAPPRMSITNREIKHSRPRHNSGNFMQWDWVPSYTSREQGEEREATMRGMVMDSCSFNSRDSFFLTFLHSPFHHPCEKPFCRD